MLWSLTIIFLGGLLKHVGEKYPQYLSNGSLCKAGADMEILGPAKEENKANAKMAVADIIVK